MNKLKVWFMPAVEVKDRPVYEKEVESLEEAVFLLDELANYTLFLGDKSIMPDYSNTGAILMFEDGEWVDWYDRDTGIDDPREFLNSHSQY